jgi:hypothetical protein
MYNDAMATNQFRREIKKAVDQLPDERLESLADYVRFLSRSSIEQRIKEAEEAFAAGKGINWREVRRDVGLRSN